MIALALWGGRGYPTLDPKARAAFAALDPAEIGILQGMAAETLYFLSVPAYRPLHQLYTRLWDAMRAAAGPALAEIADLGRAGAVQSLALSPQIYADTLVGRRSDIDVFAAPEIAEPALAILHRHGFHDVVMAEDGTLDPRPADLVTKGDRFRKLPTLSRLIPFSPPDDLVDDLPDVLPPLFRVDGGWRCFFGVQLTLGYGEGLDWAAQGHRFAPPTGPQSGATHGLPVPSPAFSAAVNLVRAGSVLQVMGEMKFSPLLDVVNLALHPDFDPAEFQAICAGGGLDWAPAALADLLAVAEGRVPEGASAGTWLGDRVLLPAGQTWASEDAACRPAV